MSHILLSICIPTYNFGKFIGQTLESIIPNLAEGVEVIILDGGSTDDTASIVAQKQKNLPQIEYYQQEFRGGIDRDIAKVVSLSHGKYCWLFSADDIMMVGAIEKVLTYIQSNCDVYLCEQMLCDYELQHVKEYPIFNNITTAEIFDLGDAAQRRRYFSNARTSEAFFSFLSGPIFRRDLWEKASGISESFYETCWGLAGRLLSLVPDGLIVHYLGEKLLYKRGVNEHGDNNSFRDLGAVNRLRISVEGLAHIAETLFGENSLETFNIRRVIRNEWPLRSLIYIKLLVATSPQQENSELLKKLAIKHYYNAGIFNMFKYIFFRLIPVPLIRLAVLSRNILIKDKRLLWKRMPIRSK
jgi:abequosyltransferase